MSKVKQYYVARWGREPGCSLGNVSFFARSHEEAKRKADKIASEITDAPALPMARAVNECVLPVFRVSMQTVLQHNVRGVLGKPTRHHTYRYRIRRRSVENG